MKLARVNHERCGQPAGKWGLSSYFWVEDGMTEDAFKALCDQAQEAYFSAERALQASFPEPPPGYAPSPQHYPDTTTVAEMNADYEQKVAAYKTHQNLITASRRSFSWHLVDIAKGAVKNLWDVPPAFDTDLSWGHNHGITVDYGDTKLGDHPPTDEEDEY